MKLVCRKLCFGYGEKRILEDLSLYVEEGEFVSLIGPSGSGKSTLFYLIGGLYQPEAGEILLDGQRINGKSGFVSYMPQASSLFPWRTVYENIRLVLEMEKREDQGEIHLLLKRAGLEAYANHYPHQLSGGMQQRVAFLRTLVSQKNLLLLDEPFGALDALTRSEMQRWLISQLMEEKRTILFITHSVEEAILLSDRIYVLTPSPMKVKAVFAVPFSREKRWDLREHPEFLQLRRKIEEMLFDEK